MKTLILLFTMLLYSNVFSQNITINGYIYDSETGEKIPNVTIVDENNIGVLSNEYGYYSLNLNNLKDSIHTIRAISLGYKTQTKKINVNLYSTVNFNLVSTTKIDSVIIKGQIPITKTYETDVIEIPINQIKLMPSIGSEPDIFKSLQLMPGIQAGSEGSSNLYVRGGAPDENLVLLDDVPLYYVNHLAGFVSIFDADAINTFKMYKGGFPARYGSRLSSVIDIRMKDGDMKNYKGKFTIGVLNAKLFFEGPIKKNKSSFLLSARVLPLSLLTKPLFLITNEGQIIGYNFHDINAKINYKINEKNHLYFSFYTGDDKLSLNFSRTYYPDQILNYKLIWGNRVFASRWNHIFNSKIFLNVTASYSQFRYLNSLYSKNTSDNNTYSYRFNSSIKDYSIKSTFSYNVSNHYKLDFGINSIFHEFNPGVNYYKITISDTIQSADNSEFKHFIGFENIFFIENKIKLGNFFKANIGVHISDYYLDNENHLSFEPRIITNIILSSKFSIKTSYTQMTQYVHLLSNNAISLTPDIWVPSNTSIKPSESSQISMGLFYHLEQKDIEISVSSFYKTSNNIISYKEGAVFNGNAENWQDKIETNGKGESYGVEFLIQKKQGKTTGWVAYTIAKSTRKFANINNGLAFPYKYDRRHDFSIVINHKINKNISFSGTWVYGSGYPFSMPIGTYNIITDKIEEEAGNPNFSYNQEVFIYSERNNFRMRAYHRLDLAANFTKKVKRGIRTWSLSIYNIYNRQNPYFYFFKEDENSNKYKLIQQSLFPIIPSISYSLKF